MNILLAHTKIELNIKNSRFIAEVFPVKSQIEARQKLHEIKNIYSDSSHVVHAFITGKSGEVNGMSDDGEPSGTAGRPILDVLKGSGITNILLTVTRYFGGTLLGTGGLVHAYGDSAKSVLSKCKTEPFVEKSTFSFTTDYSSFESIRHIYERYSLENCSEKYDTKVNVSGIIYSQEAEQFKLEIFNITRGKTIVEITKCT